jgi:hypothetical protein
MSERLSETPSDEELRAYVLANAKMSAIAWSIPDSEFADGTLATDFLASLRAFPLVGGALFVQRLLDTLVEALRRLNALPRDDPFWQGRNPRPTLYKLRDFNAAILRANPDDRLALWTQAALYVLHGSTNFGPKQWRRLHYVGDFDVRWPVLAALVTELNAEPTVEALAELLDRVEAVDEARAFLATFDACGDPWIIGWRDAVIAALEA